MVFLASLNLSNGGQFPLSLILTSCIKFVEKQEDKFVLVSWRYPCNFALQVSRRSRAAKIYQDARGEQLFFSQYQLFCDDLVPSWRCLQT